MVASEAVPYAKVGGLADVAGVLPAHLAAMGHEVRLVLPLYGSIDRHKYRLSPVLDVMGVPMGSRTVWCRVLGYRAPEGFDVYFIEHQELFGRAGIYDESGQGYHDNGWRFVFFARAALPLCIDTGFYPSVAHCHDWMTAILPAYLKYHMARDRNLGFTGSVLTLHNVGRAYQGLVPAAVFPFSGLPGAAYNSEQFEDGGWVNLLKGGISQADLLSAVSPTFAREILGPIGSGGLDPFLRQRQGDLHGILNGVDYRQWNPESDPLIPANYSADHLDGKAECKRALQATFELEQNPDVPVFGVVSRMSGQKGLELIVAALPELVESGAQFVLVGSGDRGLEDRFRRLASRCPGRVGAFIGFDNARAHLVEAGADLYLMPSLWEPCGLNQLYSLRYGTLPVVRATGGLDDTVEEYRPESGEGTGFKFAEPSPEALRDTALWAMEVYWNRGEHFRAMQHRAMRQRFEWWDAARSYEQLYRWAIAKRRHWR
ncbi:MAG: glycogen synthase [Candidatus Riflebacteria bacterium]|nr:glycogen synthase [Candidatus Riflebacteria bacterium]